MINAPHRCFVRGKQGNTTNKSLPIVNYVSSSTKKRCRTVVLACLFIHSGACPRPRAPHTGVATAHVPQVYLRAPAMKRDYENNTHENQQTPAIAPPSATECSRKKNAEMTVEGQRTPTRESRGHQLSLWQRVDTDPMDFPACLITCWI